VKAVNLIPPDARRGGGGAIGRSGGAVYLIIGLLAAALVVVVVSVLSTNTINDRKAKLAQVQSELTQVQAEATRLAPYTTFAALAQSRAAAVQSVAAQRFDWNAALSDLAKAVPASTILFGLTGAPPAASATGVPVTPPTAAGGTPPMNFALTGCTLTQNDVAQLMSRLRLMNDVTGVSLQSSSQATAGSNSAAITSSASTGGSGAAQCKSQHQVNFAMTVSFGGATAAAAGEPTTGTATPTAATVPATGTTAATQATTTGAVK
jgi:Tfp pilus assembly protein PilN